ncbi:MAG: nuclear transport factor 2 family protein [Acidimicrobiales bacterium]
MEELIAVDWAADLDTSEVLEAATAISASPTASDLGAMADQLADLGAQLDVPRARASVTEAEPRALLGRHDAGPLLALRWYAPREVSTVHHHAWTVIVQLDGMGGFERWIGGGDGGPTLRSAEHVGVGGTIRIGEGELHRQRAGEQGALELVLIGDYSADRPRVDVEPGVAGAQAAVLIGSFVAAFQSADAGAVAALCAEDVLVDVNVPHWRFQVQGRDAFAEALRMSEFGPDYRLTDWRGTPTVGGGAVIELECRLTVDGEERLAREAHLLRCDDLGSVREVVTFCTGIWNQETIEQQRLHAPMVRR